MSAPRSAHDIRESFLAFFESKGHTRVASASLVPSDPTLLFTNAGMVPFKRVFTGEETRPYKRATTTQKVMRVSGKHNDLEEVGRSARHHTFFEMLGNFSFGDYFKHEAIEFAWELITQHWKLEPKDLVVSVFREDDEAAAIWEREIGVPAYKIYRLGESENFWQMGDTGPCGPCTEIHIDRGEIAGVPNDDPSSASGRFLEFWNLVFMQFNRDASGKLTPLPKPSVDTGAGLERVAQVLNGFRNNYETDLFTPILAHAQSLSGVRLGRAAESDVSLKVVADHARAVTFMIGDGVLPANEGRGYVLRRILRRAARHGVLLGLDRPFLHEVSNTVIDEMSRAFPELAERRAYITSRVRREEERFLATLKSGLALLNDEVAALKAKGGTTLPGAVVFRLYDTFGFPVDLTQDVLKSHAMTVDEAGFASEMETQRARSREHWKGSGDTGVAQIYGRIAADVATEFTGYDTLSGESRVRALLVNGAPVDAASEGAEVEISVDETPFYAESGGQVGDRGVIESDAARIEITDTQRPSGQLVMHRGRVARGTLRAGDAVRLAVDAEARAATVRNHSGTHLLHAALREVVGPQAMQKGSLVAPDRLRFDFTNDAPLSEVEIERIEDLVNRWIEANDGGRTRQMAYKEAIAAGAMALFEEKYGDEVRVVSFGGVSTELCGGTHAKATGDIGLLKIISESGIAAGVRRIEALTGLGALAHLRAQEKKLRRVSEALKVPADQVGDRVEKLLDERKAAEKQIAELKRAQFSGGAQSAAQTREIAGVQVLVRRADGLGGNDLRGLVDDLRGQVKSGIVLVASSEEGKVALALGVSPDLKDKLKAGDLVREISAVVGGKGGGRPDFAQGGGTDAAKLDAAIERLFALVGEARA
ncbi:MAG: alanine--tRNA ligase [Deltaproteobacteria bacterium]|nr:alanine--tRNA ligase [Deltaproteobacteria bacterium]